VVVAEATNSTCPISKGVILCVDDDPMILRYEKTLLEVSGYTVLAAFSGKDALRLVTTCAFDVVILDYGMPEMSGHEVALEVRPIASVDFLTLHGIRIIDVPPHGTLSELFVAGSEWHHQHYLGRLASWLPLASRLASASNK